jgi:diguanylate cyclase (GGDEF)-like protein/PAS domain S-box-containing protein
MPTFPRHPSREPVADSRRSTRSPQRGKGNLAALKSRLKQAVAARGRAERSSLQLQQGLREVRELFETAFGDAPIGMALVDMKGDWLQVNGALCRITGLSSDELKATTLQALTHPEDVDLAADEMNSLLAGEIPSYQVEKRYRHSWGHFVWVLLTVSVVRDANGRALYVINQIQDISDRKERARQLEYLVDHDFLTGLYNRRWFERELGREVERAARYGTPGAVLVIDLDHFKDINDGFGHQAGDDLLKGVAGLLKQRARQSDVLARLGGDEFALLLPQTSPDRAELVADEIVKTLNRRMAASAGKSLAITASVGVAISDGLTNTELLAYADLAMYEAKEAGRNRFAVYHRPIKGERTSARLAEAERIRHALEENALLLYGQPVLDFQTNTLHNYELLVRLQGDNGGEPLLPSAFLYVAERFGLIQAVDAWVARTAIQLIADQERAGRRLVLSINLSGKSICDPRLATGIEEALDEAAIDPGRLIFELTETAAIGNIEQARAFATRLRRRGCQFALDDFGAGFGSFYYLKNFPFDYIKIDGGFIRELTSNPMDQLVVQAIVSIAQGLAKKTVAEFVGDQETSSRLQKLGVDCAQGYYIGEPRPIAEVLGIEALAM